MVVDISGTLGGAIHLCRYRWRRRCVDRIDMRAAIAAAASDILIVEVASGISIRAAAIAVSAETVVPAIRTFSGRRAIMVGRRSALLACRTLLVFLVRFARRCLNGTHDLPWWELGWFPPPLRRGRRQPVPVGAFTVIRSYIMRVKLRRGRG